MTTTDWLEKARGVGRLEARGEFRLDAERAKEKMARFQLVDPHRYVLELVKAAHLLEASVIEFVIDADEMEVFFDGQTLDFEEVSDFYSAAFSARTDDRQRAVRHLAIAVNAAQALGPREIVLESIAARGGCRLVLGRGVEPVPVRLGPEITPGLVKISSALAVGTRVYLRQRMQTRHIMQFFDKLKGRLNETLALEERARYATIPIVVNGVDITRGSGLSDKALAVVEIATSHERGRLGIAVDGNMQIKVLQHGVFIDTQVFTADVVGVEAIVDSCRLTTNLSQSAFVQDEAWQMLHGGVVQEAMWRSLELYVANLSLLEIFGEGQLWLRQLVLRAHARTDRVADHGFFTRVAMTPIYQQADKSMPLIAIAAATQRIGQNTRIHICRRPSKEAEALAGAPVILSDLHEPTALFLRFADEVVDLTERIEVHRQALNNKAKWASSSRDAAPPRNWSPHQMALDHGELRVVVGLNGSGAHSTVIFVKEGGPLKSGHLSEQSSRGLSFIFSGKLAANELFDGPAHCAELSVLGLALLDALPRFVNEHLQYMKKSYALDYLRALLNGRLLRCLGSDFHIEAIVFAAWQLALRSASQPSLWNRDDATAAETIELLGPAADVALFPDLRGVDHSLRQIHEHIADNRCILVPESGDLRAWRSMSEQNTQTLYIQPRVSLSILENVFGKPTIAALQSVMPSKSSVTINGQVVTGGNGQFRGEPQVPQPSPKPVASPKPAATPKPVETRMSDEERLRAHIEPLLNATVIRFKSGPAPAIAATDGQVITLFAEHPVVAHALARPDDRFAAHMVAVAARGALRPYLKDIAWGAAHRAQISDILNPSNERRNT
ncbi:MAG: hypothetical protein H0U74_20685 [Bradymonadaceae bacterium]|nr:hypothetical protein [Lujinxingiaceae bacterium]